MSVITQTVHCVVKLEGQEVIDYHSQVLICLNGAVSWTAIGWEKVLSEVAIIIRELYNRAIFGSQNCGIVPLGGSYGYVTGCRAERNIETD